MKGLIYKIMVWAADQKKTEQSEESIDKEFRQQANNRIFELEQRFETLCGHLKVSINKPYGYRVMEFNGIAGSPNTTISGNTLSQASAKMASAKNVG